MFMTIFFIACTISAFEIGIAHKWRWYRRMAGNHLIINLIGSVLLSLAVSVVFGAAGMMLMVASMLSTIMTIPYYKTMAWWDRAGQKSYYQTRKTISQFKSRWENNYKELVQNTIRVIEVTLRIITAPVRAWRWCAHRWGAIKGSLPTKQATA